jgi:hypothetical protein
LYVGLRSPPTTKGPSPSADRFPNTSNTGVPAGTTLSSYTGPCTITTAGTVIDAKTINCNLNIKAANVTISRSKINGTVATDENSTGYSFTISDSNVDVGNRPGTGIGAVNFTATRVEVTGGNRSINCWHDCVIRDSYVHGQFRDTTGTYHESGIRMGQNATIRHNTIESKLFRATTGGTAPTAAPPAASAATGSPSPTSTSPPPATSGLATPGTTGPSSRRVTRALLPRPRSHGPEER